MTKKSLMAAIMAMLILCSTWIVPFPATGEPSAKQEPVIVVGGALNYPPYEFVDKDGEPTGYNVELTRAIAQVTGMNVRISLEPSHAIFNALEEGRIDILMGVAYTESRAESLAFSSPHTIVVFSIFGRKGGPSISSIDQWHDKDIMALKSAVINELAIEQGWARSLTLVDSDEEMLRLLASGKHDYAILATKVGAHLIKNLGLTNIAPITETPEVFKYCFAGKKENRQVVNRFTEGLAILHKTGQYKKIRDKWLGDDLNPHGISWTQVVKYGSIVAVLLLAALSIIIIWYRTLKKQVAQRTAALALEVKERQRAEEELRRNQEQLVQADKMAAIGTLVSGVAHEINNPNGLILMNTTMLKEMHEDIGRITDERYENEGDFDVGKWRYSEVRENLGQMLTETVEASKRIVRIVEDLKNFSRRDDSALDELVNLNSVSMAAIRLLDPTIKKSTDSFVVHYAEELPRIRGNVQRIEQVIVNLVLNACQALPDRGKGIEYTTRYDPENLSAVLEIADEGIGINPQQLRYVTDPFFTTKREHGGTGLGLSVSSTIIKEHKGLLTFRSAEGTGTTVTVSFPFASMGAISLKNASILPSQYCLSMTSYRGCVP
jgi:signal transduction histidine kinase